METSVSKYVSSPKFCRQCLNSIPYEKRDNVFCDHSCAATYTNTRRCTREKLTESCARCSTPCSRRCRYCATCWDYLQRSGALNRVLPFEQCKTDPSRRRALLRERGHRCETCGLAEWQGKQIPIQMDHTDGNSDNSTRENLKLLCPNCHALTPTFGSKNRGNASSTRNVERRRRYHGHRT